MADVFTRKKRSYVMSRIRSRDTKIEITMSRLLAKNKINFISHPKIYGSPDFLVGTRTLLFCDGDFWHGYRYESKKKPPGGFWQNKIVQNMSRDRIVSRKLRREGWSVLRFWEHDIESRQESCLKKIERFMR
jgi:DNA mismatch endonuclease (patch repair protein)